MPRKKRREMTEWLESGSEHCEETLHYTLMRRGQNDRVSGQRLRDGRKDRCITEREETDEGGDRWLSG